MHTVSLISRYMEHPRKSHLLATKKFFRYSQGTLDCGLFYKTEEKLDLMIFTDSDYARDQDDKKSTSGYAFMLGSGVVHGLQRNNQLSLYQEPKLSSY